MSTFAGQFLSAVETGLSWVEQDIIYLTVTKTTFFGSRFESVKDKKIRLQMWIIVQPDYTASPLHIFNKAQLQILIKQ